MPRNSTRELEEELAEKDVALRSIQRNYESISTIMQLKQQEAARLQDCVDVLTAEKTDLGVRLEAALSRADKAENREMGLRKGMMGEDALHAELDKARFASSVANERVKAFQEKLESAQGQVARLEASNRRLEGELRRSEQAQDTLRVTATERSAEAGDVLSQKQALESELRARQDSMRHMSAELLEAQKTMTALRRGAKQNERLMHEAEDANRRLANTVAELQTAAKAAEVRWAATQAQVHALEGQARSQQRALEAAAEERAGLQARAAEQEAGRAAAEAGLAEAQAQAAAAKVEFRRQIEAASERYDRLVSKKAEVGGALEAVGKELAAVKALLKRSEEDRAAEAAGAVQVLTATKAEAQESIERLESHLARHRRTSEEERWRHKEAMVALGHRLDSAVSHTEALEARLCSDFPRLLDSLDQLAAVATDSAGGWEEDLGGCETRLGRLGEQVSMLAESMVRRLSATEATGAADKDALSQRILCMEDDLSAEQGAHRATKATLEETREEAARQISQLREASAREMESLRSGLTSKLTSVEREMDRLKACSDAERLSRDAEARQETERLQHHSASLQQELDALRRKAEEDLASQRAILTDDFEEKLRLEQQLICKLRASITECFSLTAGISGDIEAVDKHLFTMQITPAVHDVGQKPSEEPGEGAALTKLLGQCRIHNAYVTEAVQDMIKENRRQRDSLEAEMGSSAQIQREIVRRCFQMVAAIAGDVTAVDKHLLDMKVTEALHSGGGSQQPGDEPGDGTALEKGLGALRLHLSYIIEAVQDMVKDNIHQRELSKEELGSAVAKQKEAVRRCFKATQEISGDVRALDSHLLDMKITEALHSGGGSQQPGDDPGDGAVLEKGLSALRLHLSYIIEAVQDMVKDNVRQRELSKEELGSAVAKQKEAVRRCFKAAQEISGDVCALDSHLLDMKVTKSLQDSNYAARPTDEPGDGAALEAVMAALRLHFSYVTEAVQDLVSDWKEREAPSGVLGPDFSEVERELRNTVAKLAHAESSLESRYTCIKCLEIFKRPVSCVPCGHTYCLSCLEETQTEAGGEYHCEECQSGVQSFIDNLPLEALCSKFEYKLSALKSLRRMLKAETAPGGLGSRSGSRKQSMMDEVPEH